jgi:hypothetical protein
MTKTSVDGIVDDYLRRLNSALGQLPEPRRSQLIKEINEHIAEGRAELPAQSEGAIQGLLNRLGQPEIIADAALADESQHPGRRPHSRWTVLAGVAIAVALAGLGTAATVSYENRSPTPPPPPASTTTSSTTSLATTTTTSTTTTSTTSSTAASAQSGPTLATCSKAVQDFYVPPVTWVPGGTISQDQGVGYGCQDQEVLGSAMQQVVNANPSATSKATAASYYGLNTVGQIIVPNGEVITLYQGVCNVVPTSTLCVNG